ncbi:50S ribosomal protein L25/general stress protein Ctc [Pseudorhodobacter sp. E13]|uniref:50S ribosomal protein L25/general stress protein Ctc n=1 Tax=Pseudorhodobacter sp. E13 TaxID=2487931 RepID=UPI000F8D9FF1|nr:50S ribosomal protein L25/general stress protein Ctc [Pseudorhodobacter sp. E13]RUS63455.1 50S ribosomal protein L25/general stress protein Ctc [Pseudorhodobacter sp. E13]
MAKEIPDLVAEVRAGTGKGAARQARRDQLVPGVVYGDGKEPLAISMKYNYLIKHLKAGRFLSTLFNLKVEGEKDVRVICRDVQRHVVKDTPLHVDFMRLRANSRINLFIHVTFENHEKAPGLKKGGTLVVVRNEVELEVNASNIPDHITVDLTGLNVGDVIHINDITLPNGAKPTIDRNFVIANISAPSSLRSSGDDEAEDSAEEGEEE